MKGWEALKALEEGKKVRRRNTPEGMYYYSNGREWIYCFFGKGVGSNEVNLSAKDLFSDHWEIYEEEPEREIPDHSWSYPIYVSELDVEINKSTNKILSLFLLGFGLGAGLGIILHIFK